MAIPDLMSTLLVPICADVFSRTRRGERFLLLVGLCMAGAHAYIGFGDRDAAGTFYVGLALILLGICYSIFAAIFWTTLPRFLVHSGFYATAYAQMTVLLNLSQATVPFIVAKTISSDSSFQTTGLLFVFISLLAAGTAFLMIRMHIMDDCALLGAAQAVLSPDDDDLYYAYDDASDDWPEEFSDVWESCDEDEWHSRTRPRDAHLWDDEDHRCYTNPVTIDQRQYSTSLPTQESDALLFRADETRHYNTVDTD
jgi:hypothetical protein